jgi:predicted ester cyclase
VTWCPTSCGRWWRRCFLGHRARPTAAADDCANRGAILEDNKARVRRYVQEFQSAGNAGTALVAADILHHHGPAWTLADTTGRERAKQFITMLRAAFPDLHVVIHDQLGEGDKVMTRKSFSGTHRGEFWGIPRPASRSPT